MRALLACPDFTEEKSPNNVMFINSEIKICGEGECPREEIAEMQLELKDAIDLLYKQTAIINNLWTVYVAATFAAGGFAALTGDPITRELVAGALTIAFGAFTWGHWAMLKVELTARRQLAEEIESLLSKKAKGGPVAFAGSIKLVTRTATTTYKGSIAHASIDTCVLAAIWIRVFLVPSP